MERQYILSSYMGGSLPTLLDMTDSNVLVLGQNENLSVYASVGTRCESLVMLPVTGSYAEF